MTEYEKTADDIRWIEMDIPGRGMQKVCSISDARYFFGVSGTQLQTILNEQNVTRYETGHGRTKYVCEVDLEEVRRVRMTTRPANGVRISPKQLLAQAAALLQRAQDGHADTEAIDKWLKMYREIE
jgi:hypothetical protein